MNDDDLLFPQIEMERWKERKKPDDWLRNQQDLLLDRLRARVRELGQTPEIFIDALSNSYAVGIATPPSSQCGRLEDEVVLGPPVEGVPRVDAQGHP